MKIKSLGIALVDFVDSKQKPSLDDKLKILFEGKSPQKEAPQRLGGGTAYVIEEYRGIINPKFPIPDCFESINIYVIRQHRHIYDVTCYGELKEEVIENLDKKPPIDGQNFLEKAQEEIEHYITPHIAGIFSTDTSERHNGILLWIARLDEVLGFKGIESWAHPVVSDEKLEEWLDKNSNLLNAIKFIPNQMSCTGDSIVSPQVFFSDYTKFTIIGFENKPDLIAPIMLDGLETLLALIKPFHCSFFRIKQLNVWENKINKSRSELRKFKRNKSIEVLTQNPSSLNGLMNQYNNLIDEKMGFFEFSSQVKDELDASGDLLEDHKSCLQEQKELDHLNDVAHVKWVDTTQAVSSFFKEVYLNAEYQIERCDKKLRELDEKQNIGLRYTNDLVDSVTAHANVGLQKDVKKLTKGIFWLTLVMVILMIITAVTNYEGLIAILKMFGLI
ncbi:hypothetical protein C4E24_02805 [ANME-1 cluster archaeon AG-394-G21]|nr:hypothetical protein [ANME-1 cluster archaeon AG-394-G21]